LTKKVGAIGASLVLGIVWAVWHLPLFIIAGTAQYGTPFGPFLTTLTAWSLIVTLLVVRAGGSVIVAMLFHISANLCDFTVWQADSWSLVLFPWIVAALVAAWLMRGTQFSWLHSGQSWPSGVGRNYPFAEVALPANTGRSFRQAGSGLAAVIRQTGLLGLPFFVTPLLTVSGVTDW
jgi:cytochrome c oxidase subunit IV